MQPINEIHMRFPALSENEAFARVTVASLISQLDITLEEIEDVKTAVSEAVTNSVIHGYDEAGGDIYLNCYLFENSVRIEIKDKGIGIENIPLARRPLFTSRPGQERSGMGFTLMESFMDNLKVYSKTNLGTKVVLTKRFESLVSAKVF